jgi:serine protease Do
MKSTRVTSALVAAGILASSVAAAAAWNPSEWLQKAVAPAATTPAAPVAGNAAPLSPATAPNYRAIVQRYGPAVVGINTAGTVRTAARGLPESAEDEPFSQFFRGMPGMQGRPDRAPPALVHGQGSGFIVGADGLILTNAHVVRDAQEVTVKLQDRREYKARVLGSDPATDVAVLKIEAQGLPVVNLGNPKQLSVGDYVLAIGAPFGFEQSATSGIVSAKGRSLPGDGYVPFIQTDVAVNPGNSGGPLFDAGGAVVGINSQIYSRTGGYMGLSFAIPIDVALSVKDQIVATGKVSRARLGVAVQELNQSLSDSFKLPQPEGALVASVSPGSAASKAGLQAGDVILSFNGQPIVASGDLPALVGMARPGERASMEVWRNGKKQTLTATLAGASEKRAAGSSEEAPAGKMGVAVRPLTPEESRQVQLKGGLVVEDASGAAARSGIEAGDIIVAVNGTAVGTAAELQKLVAQAGKQLAVLVQRGEAKIFVPVSLG